MRTHLLTTVTLIACLGVATPAEAQRLSGEHWDDNHNGYRFRMPDDWAVVPPKPNLLELGITCLMHGDEKVLTIEGRMYASKPDLTVLILRAPEGGDEEEEESSGGLRDRVSTERSRPSLDVVLPLLFSGLRDFDPEDPEKDRTIKAQNRLEGRHRRWEAFTGVMEIVLDTYTFSLPNADVALIFSAPEDYAKKYYRLFGKVAQTFEEIEIERIDLEAGGTYDDQLAYHSEIVSRTPGWRVVRTPSEKFIIKTSTDDMDFVDEVIERLELSRALFEVDFPPPDDFDAVSVVRICATEEEFHTYGGTSSGVGGWFSPRTTELVLFDYKNLNRNATYAVMSHEAFHQYCHYLFDQSEAHRWFDEGHGDYYGGVDFKHGKAEVTKKMPAGFDRLSVIKTVVQREAWTPIEQHLNSSHMEWQSGGVPSYAQSWSIIYMLRQGMLGDVPRKIWRSEYEDIIPNYVSTLTAGFQDAYEEIRKEREKEARAEGRELTTEELDITRFDLDSDQKREIWEAAMEASWGDVDLQQFEEDWLVFVRKEL